MYLLTIAFLSLFFRPDVNTNSTVAEMTPLRALGYHSFTDDIDSNDQVIFDFNQSLFDGNIIEVPVFISSDDMIFSLDFSMLFNTQALEFESLVDHTGVLQYTAYVSTTDFKLRFTSNDFSPYPLLPDKVVSIRFKVLNGVVRLSDFSMVIAYLNGVSGCSFDMQLQGDEIYVANKEIITNETFISPNPAGDFIYVGTDEQGVLDIFDVQGVAVIQNHQLTNTGSNRIDIHMLPRGIYTVRLMSEDHTVKTQKIVLQ